MQKREVIVHLKENPSGRPLQAPKSDRSFPAVIDVDLPLVIPSGHSVKLRAELFITREALPKNDWLLEIWFRDAFKNKHLALISLYDGELGERGITGKPSQGYVFNRPSWYKPIPP